MAAERESTHGEIRQDTFTQVRGESARTAAADKVDSLTPLCIGDIICLFDDHNHGYVRSKISCASSGIISVDGCAEGAKSDVGDTSEILFQIQCAERYKKTKKYHQMLADVMQETGESEKSLLSHHSALRSLHGEAATEIDDNSDMQIRLFGEPLFYGQHIQLYHVRSRRHVEIDQAVASNLESENMRMNLDSKLTKNIWFTVLPRFKVRSRGERVRENDKIIFESCKVPGQYLHTSAVLHPEGSVLAGNHELNLSVLGTAYSVKIFSPATSLTVPTKHDIIKLAPFLPTSSLEAHTVICGGDVVQLVHRELDGYIAAEKKICSESHDAVIGENVHLRIRLPDPERPNRLQPPSSAVSFFRIELATMSGGRLSYGQKIRFRHVVTGLYLGVDGHNLIDEKSVTGTGTGGGELKLVLIQLNDDAVADENTWFTCHNIQDKNASEVGNGTMSRLRHVATGCWVHGAKSVPYTRSNNSSSGSSFGARLSSIVWDNAPLCHLSIVHEQLFEDAFQLQLVDLEQVNNAYFVQGTEPVLAHFVKWRKSRVLTPAEHRTVDITLQRLCDYVYDNNMAQKKKQKLLRNFCIVDILVAMLGVPFKPLNTSASAITLEQLQTEEELNRTIGNIFPLLKAYLDGESRKNELYAGRHIAFFFTLLGGYMDVEPLLIEMVRDNYKIVSQISGVEIAHINSFVTLGSKDPDFLELIAVLCEVSNVPIRMNQTLATTTLLKQSANCLYKSRVVGSKVEICVSGDWRPIESFRAGEVEGIWLEKQVYLLSKLCKGRFEYAKKIISDMGLISWDICMLSVKNDELNAELRAAYVDLMISMYVDVAPNKPALDSNLVFTWESITSNVSRQSEQILSVQIDVTQNFDDLAEWIAEVLTKHKFLIVSDISTNNFLRSVIHLLYYLVLFGFYLERKCVEIIMEPLLNLIDGADDFPSPPIFNFKSIEHEQLYNKNLCAWRETGRFVENHENLVAVSVKYEALSVLECLMNQLDFLKLRVLCVHMKEVTDHVKAGNRMFKGKLSSEMAHRFTHFVSHSDSPNMVTPTQHTALVRKYLKNIHADYDWVLGEWTVYENASPNCIVQTLSDLARYKYAPTLHKAMALISRIYSASERLLSSATNCIILTEDISVKFYNATLPFFHMLRELCRGYIGDGDSANYCKILNFLECKCEIAGTNGKPHCINQKILFKSGLLHILLDVIDYDGGQSSAVLDATFRLLSRLVHVYPEAQKSLFKKLDMVLSCKFETTDFYNEMSRAIHRMFEDNEPICLQITKEQIKMMSNILASNSVRVPEMLEAMKATVKAGGIVLKRNQRLIVKALTENQENCLQPAMLMMRDLPVQAYATQLIDMIGCGCANGATIEEQAQYTYHVKMVSLVAACAENAHRFVQSMCRSTLPLAVIVKVFLSPRITRSLRACYMRYICAVFGSITAEQGVPLSQNNELFQCLLAACDNDLKSLLTTSSTRDIKLFVLKQQEYIFESLLPLLVVILKKHYKPAKNPTSADIVKKVTKIVVPILEKCAKNLTSRENVYIVNEVLTVLHVGSSVSGEVGELGQDSLPRGIQKALSSRVQARGIDFAEVEEFRNRYHDQDRMNDMSSRYFMCMMKAYKGKNQVAEQLGRRLPALVGSLSKNDQAEAYCEEEGSDEYIPLGPEFQQFTGLFIDFKNREPILNMLNIGLLKRVWQSSNTTHGVLSAANQQETELVEVMTLQALRACIYTLDVLNIDSSEIQTQICRTGPKDVNMIEVLIEMLRRQSENLRRESLALMVQLMKGGNDAAQNAAREFFESTREEAFFDQILSILHDSQDRFVDQKSINKQILVAKAMENFLDTSSRASDIDSTLKSRPRFGRRSTKVRPDITCTENKKSSAVAEIINAAHKSRTSETNKTLSPNGGSDLKDTQILKHDSSNEETGIKAIAELALRVIQLLCEGHNDFMRNYLREQLDNIRSVDLVAAITIFFGVIAQNVTCATISVTTQVLDTLIELAQGCELNQKTIFDNDIIGEINSLLRQADIEGCASHQVARIHLSCAFLLQTLLENNNVSTKTLASQMEETADLSALLVLVKHYHNLSKQKADAKWIDESDNDILTAHFVGYAFRQVLFMLEDHTGIDYLSKCTQNIREPEEVAEAYHAFEENSLSIEFIRYGNIQKVHFEAHQKDALTQDMKNHLQWNVNRESAVDKIRDFMARAHVIECDIDYLKACEDSNFFIGFIIQQCRRLRILLLVVTYIINALILIAWDANDGDLFDVAPVVPEWYPVPFTILACIHIFISTLVVFAYYVMNPLSAALTFESIPLVGNILAAYLPAQTSEYTCQSLFSVLSLYHIVLLTFSVLGLFYHGYFYSFHLLHIIIGNDILHRVIQSVTKNGVSLLWVMFLMLIIIYIYSLIAFAFLRETFTFQDGEWCDTEWMCFVTSIRLGLMSGGGLGEVLEPEQYEGLTPSLRGIFDVSFFIVITVIGLNVVFGIIVDTFSELRDEKYAIQDAMENECFICSRKRSEFEQQGKGFKYHAKYEHNMWSYIHYIIYLNRKDPTMYTSHENYIFTNFQNESTMTNVFPINRARSLPDNNDGAGITVADSDIYEKLNALTATVQTLVKEVGVSNNSPRSSSVV